MKIISDFLKLGDFSIAKLETLRAFVLVARHGNLRDAAHEIGRTQSALSMALSQLEAALGGPLFETDRKRNLTDLGQFVLDAGTDLVREHDRVMELIHGYAAGEAGHLRIASVPSVAALILPGLLGPFIKTHAGARVDLVDSDSNHVRELVSTGQADLAIAGDAPAGQALLAEPLFQDRLHVVCKSASMLGATRGTLHWKDLYGSTFIVNEAMSNIDEPDAVGVMAASTLSVRNILSLFAMVSAGNGVTVLPGLATLSLSDGLTAIPMSGPGSHRTISLLSRDGLTGSPLSNAFRKHVIASIPDIVARFDLLDCE